MYSQTSKQAPGSRRKSETRKAEASYHINRWNFKVAPHPCFVKFPAAPSPRQESAAGAVVASGYRMKDRAADKQAKNSAFPSRGSGSQAAREWCRHGVARCRSIQGACFHCAALAADRLPASRGRSLVGKLIKANSVTPAAVLLLRSGR